MKVVNLTPHQIVTQNKRGQRMVFDPDPNGPARVKHSTNRPVFERCPFCDKELGCSECNGLGLVPYKIGFADVFTGRTDGKVYGLPGPEKGTVYLVSLLVAQQVTDRYDVYYPGTGPNDECIRDDKGRVVAVTRLIQAATIQQQQCPKGCDSCGI